MWLCNIKCVLVHIIKSKLLFVGLEYSLGNIEITNKYKVV